MINLSLTVNKIENSILNDLVNLLNENNVNVEIQSINKREDNTVIVLKLSDFNLKSLTLVEEFFKKQKTSKSRTFNFFPHLNEIFKKK